MPDYLTEKKLGEILPLIFKKEFINNFPIGRYKADRFSPALSLAVEFDGYRHYTDSLTQCRDKLKDSFLSSLGVKCIRIPYFIQLSRDTINSVLFFEGSFTEEWPQSYPHGFIEAKALLPADFNELGVYKFISDMNRVQISIRREIINSLLDRANLVKLKTTPFEKLSTVFPLSIISGLEDCNSLDEKSLIIGKISSNLLI
jgi:hypothetical protein